MKYVDKLIQDEVYNDVTDMVKSILEPYKEERLYRNILIGDDVTYISVSNWLAGDLIDEEEVVDEDFYGFCIWSRTEKGSIRDSEALNRAAMYWEV